jgi:hypothetical protein
MVHIMYTSFECVQGLECILGAHSMVHIMYTSFGFIQG